MWLYHGNGTPEQTGAAELKPTAHRSGGGGGDSAAGALSLSSFHLPVQSAVRCYEVKSAPTSADSCGNAVYAYFYFLYTLIQ